MRGARRTWSVRRSDERPRQRRKWARFSSLPEQKIARPRQRSLGAKRRDYVPLERRK